MSSVSRRGFLAAASAGAALGAAEKPAVLGGQKVRAERWPSWPVYDRREEEALIGVLKSGEWFRGDGKRAGAFEKAYAELTGAKGCLATANGTSALLTSLAVLGVGPDDEVILPPYTFVATVNVVLMLDAVPVFVDSDRETFQIDARKIEAAITPKTRAIMPVHLGGNAADLDAIMSIAKKRNLPVVEDACQAHLAEWRGRKVGTYGATGCFSFQASKNLNSGEGGAIISNDSALIEKCFAFHNNSRGRKAGGYDFAYASRGLNLRLSEFQAALLVAQMSRLEEQSRRRSANAEYLTGMLREIPGIHPARMYEGCTRNAYHLYMFRYEKERFANLPRAKFLHALRAEGVPCSPGYAPLNKEPFVRKSGRGACPENDRLCEEAVWLTQNMLLADRASMEQIAEAVRKTQAWAAQMIG